MKQYDFINDPDSNGNDSVVVADKPKRKLDIWPRVVCLLIAIGIWLYMVNLNDTDVPSEMILRINVEGVDELRANDNMLIYGMDKLEVKVTVKGSNRDLKKYSESDYRAVVDVSQINKAGRHVLPVKIEAPAGSSITVVNTEPLNINLYSDYSMTKTIPFDWIQGDVVTIPTYTYDINKNVESIEITGPKSIIETIESAKYIIEGEFYSSKTFSGFTDMKFCDKNGDYMSYESGTVLYSTTDVVVSVSVTTQKTVPIVVNIMGGNNIVGIANPGTVTVVGDPLVLARIPEYVINLSEAYVGRVAQVTLTAEQFSDGVKVEGEGSNIIINFENAKN